MIGLVASERLRARAIGREKSGGRMKHRLDPRQCTGQGGGALALVVMASLTVLWILGLTPARADMTWTFAVRASAAVESNPARITLNWPTDPFAISGYSVYRKAVEDSAWGEGIALPGHALGYTDENVQPGRSYEYQIIKHASGYTGYGYIAVGLEAPLMEQRGKVVVMVDDTLSGPLAAEISRLQRDLAGDGWAVVRKDVSRSAQPAEVRAVIQNEYRSDPERTKAVLLLGNIPVVRSGNLNVDGHGARPMPADVFYGDMDGQWTDVNGDGIYDQNTIPAEVTLQVGRIDFANLPGRYSPVPYASETELTRRYLDKNHAFRHAIVRPAQRALISDAIGDAGGQAYAASAHRNFSALVGPENVVLANSEADAPQEKRWIARLAADSYLWSYANGAGSDTSISRAGTHAPYGDAWASDFIEREAKGTFYMFFGSWLGDWSKPDNFMRTALAAPHHGLTASWSGRPHHFYHHMGIGQTIGYGIRVSQNNAGLYQNQVQRQLRGVHIALLGDPTLRLHPLAPPREAALQEGNNAVTVSWMPSSDPIAGYQVYRAASANGAFHRVSTELVTDTRFLDPAPDGGEPYYQVRAIARHSGPSGSYFNSSQGAFASRAGAPLTDVPPPSISFEPSRVPDPAAAGETIWIDDSLPAGATSHAINDRWNWVTANPAPHSGTRAHQSDNAPGVHLHFFVSEVTPLLIGVGDTLFAYVYLDPDNPPRQLILSWLADNHWEHRAYWGENLVEEGIDGGPGRRHMGPLPPTGEWVRLEVPASAVDLENRTATGMGFTLFDGRATWDRAGKRGR
jgi:hypothetical protein